MLGILKDTEINAFLSSQRIGRLGCHSGGKTYVVPLQYRFKGDHLLCYSMEGMKLEFMRSQPQVCFEVDLIHSMNEWTSVILWGRFEEIGTTPPQPDDQQWFSIENLEQKASPNSPPPEGQPNARREALPAYREAIFYKIHIEEKTGRFEKPLL